MNLVSKQVGDSQFSCDCKCPTLENQSQAVASGNSFWLLVGSFLLGVLVAFCGISFGKCRLPSRHAIEQRSEDIITVLPSTVQIEDVPPAPVVRRRVIRPSTRSVA